MHELGCGIYTVDVHVGWDVEEDVCVVQDHPDIGVDHQFGDLLGRGRWGGDDADDLLGLGDALLELVYVLDDDVAHGASDLLRVVVEDVVDDETSLGEDVARPFAPAPSSWIEYRWEHCNKIGRSCNKGALNRQQISKQGRLQRDGLWDTGFTGGKACTISTSFSMHWRFWWSTGDLAALG